MQQTLSFVGCCGGLGLEGRIILIVAYFPYLANTMPEIRQLAAIMFTDIVGYTALMAFRYYMINQDDKAIGWIKKGAEVSDPSTLYIGTGFYNCTRLYDNPRFIEVFEKMNLPLP